MCVFYMLVGTDELHDAQKSAGCRLIDSIVTYDYVIVTRHAK